MFFPSPHKNVEVTPAAGSLTEEISPGTNAVRLVNNGANICFVVVTNITGNASVADTPVRAAEAIVLGKNPGDTFVSYISAAGTTLQIQPGQEVY